MSGIGRHGESPRSLQRGSGWCIGSGANDAAVTGWAIDGKWMPVKQSGHAAAAIAAAWARLRSAIAFWILEPRKLRGDVIGGGGAVPGLLHPVAVHAVS